jgi:hypothetical protein
MAAMSKFELTMSTFNYRAGRLLGKCRQVTSQFVDKRYFAEFLVTRFCEQLCKQLLLNFP